MKKKAKFFHLILAFNIVTVLLCSATISSVIYGRFNQTLNQQNEEFMHYATSQALNGIENIMMNIELTARNIYSDSTVASLFLGQYSGDVDYDLFRRFLGIDSLFENYATTNHSISSIAIYKLDPQLITDGKNIKSIESFARQDLIRRAIDAKGKDVWVAYEEEGAGTKIMLLKYININLPGGVLAIELNQERLTDLYKAEQNAKYLLYLSSEGRIVFRSNEDVQIGEDVLEKLEASTAGDHAFSRLKQGRSLYYSYYGKANNALTVAILYDAYELGKEKRAITKYVILCTCFFVFVGVAIAILFSKKFSQNIERLVKKIRAIEKGSLKIVPDTTSIAEIAALDGTLCRMADRIDGLTGDIARTERQKVATEIKYLQKQMHPHFLYNLLSAVRWMAFRNQDHQIVNIIDLLSDFYKIALSQGRDTIPLRSEIRLIENYVALQNLCLSGGIRLTVRVGEELDEMFINKMTLQPFVENSIIHGRVQGKQIHITVDIQRRGENVFLTIGDDGMGAKESFIAYIDHLNRGEIPDNRMGYGVTNTFMRLKLLYSNARIQVRRSHPGTVVEISYSVKDKPALDHS